MKEIYPLERKDCCDGAQCRPHSYGGGSGFVTPFSTVSVSEGLEKLKKKNLVLLTDDVIYEDILHEFYADAARQTKGFKAEYFKNKTLSDNRRSFVQKHQLIMTGNMEHHWKVFRKMDFLSVGQPVICLKRMDY